MFNYPPSPELDAECKRARYRNKLEIFSDDEIVNIFRLSEKKFVDRKIYPLLLSIMPEDFYKVAAEIDILRDRHGDSYVENLTCVPQPKTLLEKIYKFFF